MKLYDVFTPVETMLAQKSDELRSALGGTMELTPLCNMNCKMCYIRQNPEEMRKQGRLLSCDEWLKIAEELHAAGVLFLLLTGGEPLVYPEFKRLYSALTDMGFVITINTNGTLIDEEMADFFASRPCRRLNITLYGEDDEAYQKICGNPKGHTQFLHALDLLKERNIPHRINYTITPDNVSYLNQACKFALSRGLAFEPVAYLFPPIRRENDAFQRLSPADAAKAKVDYILNYYGEADMRMNAVEKLKTVAPYVEFPGEEGKLRCRAGRSGFWIDWTGHLLPCGMFLEPKVDLLTTKFSEAWNIIVKETEKLRMYSGCSGCEKKRICNVCAAGCLTESGGDMTKCPEYICQITDEYYKLLVQYADRPLKNDNQQE